jgi:hypothetical protein
VNRGGKNWIICKILGHKKYSPKALEGNDLFEVKDSMGYTLVTINVCERCGKVYSTFIA